MTDPLTLHPPSHLVRTLLDTTLTSILPLSRPAMSEQGTKLFGAAILHKPTLRLVLAETNHESASPLNHGETYAVMKFFEMTPAASRPDPRDCVFFATHEPCSLCINAIVWSGFDNFVYLWDYEETDGQFGIPGDLNVWHDCFYDERGDPQQGGGGGGGGGDDASGRTGKGPDRRPALYKKVNARFVARSVGELVAAVADDGERAALLRRVDEVKREYGRLSPTYCARMGLE